MPNIDKSIHFILYADDANIIVTGKTLQIIQKQIQKCIPQLLNWINSNALKLNIDKTKYMIFSNTSKYDINIEINDTKIKRVTQDKFLGVLIDEKLTWAAHKVAIAKKVSGYCGVLFRARHILNLPSLKTLYYSFIQSHLVYCCNVWGAGSKKSINQIFLAQKRAIRTIFFVKLYEKEESTGKYKYGHTKNYFNNNGILTIHNLILMQILNQMHKINLNLAPENIISLFEKPEAIINANVNSKILNKKLHRQGIDQSNIVYHNKTYNKVYFKTHKPNLTSTKMSIHIIGPITYNYFINYINNTMPLNNKYVVEKMYPKTFKNCIKCVLLDEQSKGEPDTWDPTNMPMYIISTTNIMLRNRL